MENTKQIVDMDLEESGGISSGQKMCPERKESRHEDDGSFSLIDGSTLFTVGVHFAKSGKETLEEKINRLIRQEIQNGNF